MKPAGTEKPVSTLVITVIMGNGVVAGKLSIGSPHWNLPNLASCPSIPIELLMAHEKIMPEILAKKLKAC